MNQEFIKEFNEKVGILKLDISMKSYSTIKIGGKTKCFYQVNDQNTLVQLIKLCLKYNIEYRIIGMGSNILIRDEGFDGLIIKNNLCDIRIIQNYNSDETEIPSIASRGDSHELGNSFNNQTELVFLSVGSGISIYSLIYKTLELKLTGLEWFYGIPATVGGAIYMNIHGGNNQLFSNFICEVTFLDKDFNIVTKSVDQLKFDYDYSVFHENKYIILSSVLRLYKGDIGKADQIIAQWGKEKVKLQPQKSLGCVFQNINKEQQEKLNIPTQSFGYIIDNVLGLRGYKIGDAIISEKHAGFIENLGNATSDDFLKLIAYIKEKSKLKLGFEPKLEIEII